MFSKRQLLTVFVCLAVVGAAGCASDEEPAEATFTVKKDGISARLWIPANEPSSIGTYRAEVQWPEGESGSVDAERDGQISGVWLADLDGEGPPELIVATSSAGSGSYGSVDIYQRGEGRLTKLEVNPLNDEQQVGYMGHDVFSVKRDRLYRSFPLYLPGDPNAAPTGGTVLFWYSFADSMWIGEAPAAAE